MAVVSCDSPLPEEPVEPGAFGQHMKVDGAQGLDRCQTHDLGQQPAGNDDQNRHQQAWQEGSDLQGDGPNGLQWDGKGVHVCFSGSDAQGR